MTANGAFRERLHSAWTEIRENLGRSILQALGVMLGVASVLGGFSISDSQRQRASELFVRIGGLDKLNVQPSAAVPDGAPTAMQMANLGLRRSDAEEGQGLDRKMVEGISQQKFTQARVRSPYADEERRVTGIGGDYLAINGYDLEEGRSFSTHDLETGTPTAILGKAAVATFFPTGEALGQRIRIGDIPVTVVGVLREKVFRFRDGQGNVFAWRNKIVAVPATLIARRMQGDAYSRLDRVTFRIPKVDSISTFSRILDVFLTANHRLQRDFRLDDVARRMKRMQSQGDIYDLIFMLSGILALIGGGMVNVNVQMATLKERVREVGVKMAIGASGAEVFKEFMTEALLVTLLGGFSGMLIGVAFSKLITASIGIPLHMYPGSFVAAFLLALVFGFLFALYPAFKASRLSPMEALRYE